MYKGGKGAGGLAGGGGKGAQGAQGQGAWGSFRPGGAKGFQGGGKGQGGKGKGFGRGGQQQPQQFDTRNAAAIASRRAQESGAQALCPSEAKYGVCTFEQWKGRPCKYMHLKDLPRQIAAIDGLISTDFPGLPIEVDLATNKFVCQPCSDQALIDKLVKDITADTARVANILAEEAAAYDYNFDEIGNAGNSSTSNSSVQPASGFPGQAP